MHRDPSIVTETQPWPAARVLVAEDDDELRWLITRTLRKSGFDVIEASDGAALLDRAGETLLTDKPFDMDHLCDVVLTSLQWKSRAPKLANGARRPRETH